MRRMLERGVDENKAINILAERIAEIKGKNKDDWIDWAKAVLLEVKNAKKATKNPILSYYISGIKAGEAGLGSRGEGDFYIHSLIAEIIKHSGVSGVIPAEDLDDAGVVRVNGKYVYAAIDGIHSRLSEFPFIAGFHVTRAAMRDVLVMGAKPIAVFSDIHIADDGDVSKVFDHVAGICAVCELTKTPLVAGSTLRIGGDMVIGERFSGGVGCIGYGDKISARRNAENGDVIILTEGAGGGTVTTTAIYYGYPEVVEETINVDFIKACMSVIENDKIHAMTDVTNGGIRGDAEEISRVSGMSLIFDEEILRKTINKKVMNMFEEVGIDYLGVSTDSLMIICDEGVKNEVVKSIKSTGVKAFEVGRVEKLGNIGAYIEREGKLERLKPKFRESAYTPIKKVVGESKPQNFDEIREKLKKAAEEAINKKNKIVSKLK